MAVPRKTLKFPPVVRIGVSACLTGKDVRFDGGHKRSRFITDVLADYFELVPFVRKLPLVWAPPGSLYG